MIFAVDSSASRPDSGQVALAKSQGLSMWCGYLEVLSNVGLYAPWDDASIIRVRDGLPAKPIMFVSGWDDPVAVRNRAAALGVLACLDVENGIRGDGDWVQDWLNRSGAGLYGNLSVHWHAGGRVAAFNIVSDYPGYNPNAIWPPGIPRPDGTGPLGWQWMGTHTLWGHSVDSLWLDDRFLTPVDPPPLPVPLPPPPPKENPDMSDVAYLDMQLQLGQQQIFWVDAAGNLLQRVYNGQGWSSLTLATGLAPRTPVTVVAADDIRQTHVVARMADGTILHAVAPYSGSFVTEIHGAADGGLPAYDVKTMAAAIAADLAPLLPSGSDPAAVAAAVEARIAAQFAKP